MNDSTSPNKGTLLIIDDTPELVRLLLNFLTKAGFEVLIAQDGQRGIERAQQRLTPITGYDTKSVIVPTKGTCNTSTIELFS